MTIFFFRTAKIRTFAIKTVIIMTIEERIIAGVQAAVKALYEMDASAQQVQLQKTKAEFEGHLTVVVFPFVKAARKSPEQVGNEIGQYLLDHTEAVITKFNVVKGFLNLVISDAPWITLLNTINAEEKFGFVPVTEQSPLVMIEYSSPNTNKPLHLGHVRNNLLGSALARIIEANGNKVVKTNIVNDRGIHICKSMLAWIKWGNGETPETSGKKGDHLIGDYYVAFDRHYRVWPRSTWQKAWMQRQPKSALSKKLRSSRKPTRCSSSGNRTTLRCAPFGRR